MPRPRIRHIAINVQNQEKEAEYYKAVFGMEEKMRGEDQVREHLKQGMSVTEAWNRFRIM